MSKAQQTGHLRKASLARNVDIQLHPWFSQEQGFSLRTLKTDKVIHFSSASIPHCCVFCQNQHVLPRSHSRLICLTLFRIPRFFDLA